MLAILSSTLLLLLGSVSAGPFASPNAEPITVNFNHTITGAPAEALNAVQPLNQPHALLSDTVLDKFKTAKVGDRVHDGNTVFIFNGASKSKTNDKNKRQYCYTNSYKAVQVPNGQSGTWWGDWQPAAGCYYTGYSNNNGNCQNLGASVTTSWSYSAGFDTGVSGDVLNIINGNANFNFGYTWGYSTSTSTSVNCCPGGNSVGQIWSQSQYGWSNSQTQMCYYDSCNPRSSNTCGAWSAYQHADWALPNGLRTINYGCSTGYDRVRC